MVLSTSSNFSRPDDAFRAVVEACATLPRPHGWLNTAFVDAYFDYLLEHLNLIRMSETAAPGARCFFLFELKATGMKDRLEFVPVIVHLDGTVDEELGRDFPLLVDEAEAVDTDAEPLLSASDIETLEDTAITLAAMGVSRFRRMCSPVLKVPLALPATNTGRSSWL